MLLNCFSSPWRIFQFRCKLFNCFSFVNQIQIMASEDIIKRIQANYARGEEIIKFIEKELPALQKAAALKQQEMIATECLLKNAQLKKELEFWKKRVVDLEIQNGIKLYPLPSQVNSVGKQQGPDSTSTQSSNAEPKPTAVSDTAKGPVKSEISKSNKIPKDVAKKEGKKEKPAKAPKQEKAPAEDNKEINVSRLDLRIGRILNAKCHPDAESLYVEEIDVGEDKPRTVVSGLVKFVPLEEMQNRLVVVLCNLKPAKMRGVTSEAMVMCASTPEKVEILSPPPGSAPGDRVSCDEFPGEPDTLLNPKKKIFEQVAPDLKTDGECSATYKAALLKVAGKGVVTAASLTNVQIK